MYKVIKEFENEILSLHRIHYNEDYVATIFKDKDALILTGFASGIGLSIDELKELIELMKNISPRDTSR